LLVVAHSTGADAERHVVCRVCPQQLRPRLDVRILQPAEVHLPHKGFLSFESGAGVFCWVLIFMVALVLMLLPLFLLHLWEFGFARL